MARLLICGLGNPGRHYERTRHNIGFMIVDALADSVAASPWRPEHQALTTRAVIDGHQLVLAKPQTFMNNSGIAVRALQHYHHIPAEGLLVVSDDLDLPFGRLRLRNAGSAGGHNGLRSIIAELGTQDFARLRAGIGRPVQGAAIDWVLGEFSTDERVALGRICDTGAAISLLFMREGAIAAMNACNGIANVRVPAAVPPSPARRQPEGTRADPHD